MDLSGIGPTLVRLLAPSGAQDLLAELFLPGKLLEAEVISVFEDHAMLALGKGIKLEVSLQTPVQEGQRLQLQVQPRPGGSAGSGGAPRPILLKLLSAQSGRPEAQAGSAGGGRSSGAMPGAPAAPTVPPVRVSVATDLTPALERPTSGTAPESGAASGPAAAGSPATQSAPPEAPGVPALPALSAPPEAPGAPGLPALQVLPEALPMSALPALQTAAATGATTQSAAAAGAQAGGGSEQPGNPAPASGAEATTLPGPFARPNSLPAGPNAQAGTSAVLSGLQPTPASSAPTAEASIAPPPNAQSTAEPAANADPRAGGAVGPQPGRTADPQTGRTAGARLQDAAGPQAQNAPGNQTGLAFRGPRAGLSVGTAQDVQIATAAPAEPDFAAAISRAMKPDAAVPAAASQPQNAPTVTPQMVWLPIPLSQGGQAWAQLVVQEDAERENRGGAPGQAHQVRLWWETPSLGPVHVTLEAQDRNLTAVFTTPSADTRQALEQGLPELQQRLAAVGFPESRLGSRPPLPGEPVGPIVVTEGSGLLDKRM